MTIPPIRLVRSSELPEDATPPPDNAPHPSQDSSAVEISDALEDVVRRFGNFMRRTAHRHNLAAAEIDEVMQETRIRLWKALGTSDRIQKAPASYIYRTVTSAALDFLRRRRVRREESLDARADALPTYIATARTADHAQRASEVQTAIAQSVDLLVESRRAVVRMYLAGFDRDEIQQLLGWSEAKTRNLLYRGLADLREALESLGYGPGGGR